VKKVGQCDMANGAPGIASGWRCRECKWFDVLVCSAWGDTVSQLLEVSTDVFHRDG
jgi:hypothetical protein